MIEVEQMTTGSSSTDWNHLNQLLLQSLTSVHLSNHTIWIVSSFDPLVCCCFRNEEGAFFYFTDLVLFTRNQY